mgnify:CR=1 FL=1
MAGLIRSEDIQAVKERTSLEDVVREHVTLRTAGVGSLKGLCPFHDEKTPSFQVRPAVGHWHCFGCGEGGDVIEFVQKIDHLSFTEAVERLAGEGWLAVLRCWRATELCRVEPCSSRIQQQPSMARLYRRTKSSRAWLDSTSRPTSSSGSPPAAANPSKMGVSDGIRRSLVSR